jgi:protein TonB
MALNRILPIYPRSARRRGREGSVTLQVTVSELGEVSDTEVVVSSGHRELDSAAESAVRSARFVPASEDGVNIQGMVRLTFDFKLK